MAIVLDATATSSDSTSSPFTWSHTCDSSGHNLLLAVGVASYASTTLASVSGVTYNGVAMTKARADSDTSGTDKVETSVWFLYAPATGSNTVSVSFSGGTSPHLAGVSASYANVLQTSVADASNGTTGTVTGDATFAVTTVANNCWVFTVGMNVASISATLAADQTSRGTQTLAAAGLSALMRVEDTNASVRKGSNTVGFTVGGTSNRRWIMTGASFAPQETTFKATNSLRPHIFSPGLAR